ncbi:hypothetical protein RB653_007066 [Dictyostelium firmibasis]|uniref:Peptidase M20 dimerisation domain-containing protein n=1 Tax=Dictyostelium firmibasis TaxID=79012 RepID=A0AAN7YQW6_9MYCE
MIFKFFFIFFLIILIIKTTESVDSSVNVHLTKSRAELASSFKESLSFKTISFDKDDQNNKIDYSEFLRFHIFLQNKYPLIHKILKKTVINKYSLLFEWTGSDKTLKPLLLNSHYDVVPVVDSEWAFNPWGEIRNDNIYGRGTIDNKVVLMATMESIEAILANNYTQPIRTIYLCFGHDEEIGGLDGHRMIAKHFREISVKAEAIFDEGCPFLASNFIQGFEDIIAGVGVFEKGYLFYKLTSRINTFTHSAIPPQESAIGILSKALSKIESNPFAPVENIEKKNQLLQFFNGETIKSNPFLNSMTKTTTALSMVQAGTKPNVIPTTASAWVSHRIINGNSIEFVKSRILDLINDTRITMEIEAFLEPSPISSPFTTAYQILKQTIYQQFGGYNVKVVPTQLMANTDTRHYWDITDNIYRFIPIVGNFMDFVSIHGNNEKISIDDYIKTIHFYKKLILNFQPFSNASSSNHINKNLKINDYCPNSIYSNNKS